MAVHPDLLQVLVCPACKGVLAPTPAKDALDCRACALRFPIVDDIPVMLLDQAEKLAPAPPGR